MKRIVLIVFCFVLLFLSACHSETVIQIPEQPTVSLTRESTVEDSPEIETVETVSGTAFQITDENHIVTPDGTEYVFLANEGFVCTFGERTLLGRIEGENVSFTHLGAEFETGMFACEGDPDRRILVRSVPDSEWLAYYRKASLPPLDPSPDNCVRMEFVLYGQIGIEHLTCGEGIVGAENVKAFLADIRSQQTVREANLYDLCRTPDGYLENCRQIGCVYGFFQSEPNLAVPLPVTSYNDKAYSISLGNSGEYVLPESWLAALTASNS